MLVLLESHFVYSRFRRQFKAESEMLRLFNVDAVLIKLFIPKRASEKRVLDFMGEFAQTLVKMRSCEVCPRKDFQYGRLLTEYGVKMADTKELLEAKAAEILQAACGKRERVLVLSDRMNGNVARCVSVLAEKYRYIEAVTPNMDAIFDIAWRHGVSPEIPAENGKSAADGVICFGAPKYAITLCPDAVCLFTDMMRPENISGGKGIEKISFTVPGRLRGDVPEGYDPSVILSKAVSCGALELKSIKISAVSCGDSPSES